MSLEEAKSCKRTQFLATFIATIGSLGLGTVLSWPAPTLPQLSASSCSAECDHHLVLSIEQQSWVTALINFGAFTTGPLTSVLMPRYGKKWTMMLLSVPIFIGWILLICATSARMIYIGRFLTGFAGAFSMLAPGYIAEICEVECRGSLASFMQVVTMLGLLTTYTIGTWLDWRSLSLVRSVIPLLVIVCLYFLPRSPMFLLTKNQRKEAMSSLELLQMETSTKQSQNAATLDLKPISIGLMLMLLQQFSGIKVISSYIVQIFQNAGSKFDANICSIVVGVIQVTGTSISVLVVDKFGRRQLLIISEMFISISFCMLATFFFIQERHSPCPAVEACKDQVVTAETIDNLAWLPPASIVTFAVSYSMGMGPLPWVLNAELFSKEAKTASSSICGLLNSMLRRHPHHTRCMAMDVYLAIADFSILASVTQLEEMEYKINHECFSGSERLFSCSLFLASLNI